MEVKRIIVGPLGTNCYLIISRGKGILIDPGTDSESILNEIKQNLVEVEYIINTHYHDDHVGANSDIKKETGARILIHEAEKDFIDFHVDKFLADGEIVDIPGVKLKVMHTPGHTKGSICLSTKEAIFTGDTLFMDGMGRTDLPGGSEEELEESLEVLYWAMKPGMMVYPGHGEVFES